jgi:hypothetical protein
MKCTWSAALVAAASLLVAGGVSAQQPAATPADTVNALWVERDVNFNFAGFTSYYSCDGLRSKLEWLLGELGVQPGFKVRTHGCVRLSGPELMPGARIVATVPLAATPELLAELAEDASRRELAARATGGAAPVPETAAQFPARVRRIEFRSTRSSSNGLQDGDCELMERARRQLFPQLGVRVVEGQISCTPGQLTLGAVRITVEVLEPVPPP